MHAAVENNGLSGTAFPTVVVLTGETGLCRLEVVLVLYFTLSSEDYGEQTPLSVAHHLCLYDICWVDVARGVLRLSSEKC